MDKRVQGLIELIFNVSSFNAALEEFNIDPKKMPLGKLSKAQILHGFKILKRIEDALSSPSSDTARIISEQSSRFYTVIPHAFKHNTAPHKISSLQLVKHKISILEVNDNLYYYYYFFFHLLTSFSNFHSEKKNFFCFGI